VNREQGQGQPLKAARRRLAWLPHRSRLGFRWAEWGPSLGGIARRCALPEHAVQKGSCPRQPRRVTRLEPRGVPAVQKGLVSRDQHVTIRRGRSFGAWGAVSRGGWLHPAVDRRGYGNDGIRAVGLLREPPMRSRSSRPGAAAAVRSRAGPHMKSGIFVPTKISFS
jgi:hypothetical protein